MGVSVNRIMRRQLIAAVTVIEMEESAGQSRLITVHLMRTLFCPYVMSQYG
jgi:hypothetical protein